MDWLDVIPIAQTGVPQQVGLSLVEASAIELVNVGRGLQEGPDPTSLIVLDSDASLAGELGEARQRRGILAIDGYRSGSGHEVRRKPAGRGIAELNVAPVEVAPQLVAGEGDASDVSLVLRIVKDGPHT